MVEGRCPERESPEREVRDEGGGASRDGDRVMAAVMDDDLTVQVEALRRAAFG